ncbi:unnamed protein product [Angiostrongylus costaricensis]|uniref:Collagen alpha-1(I) chain-like n=1 Tax=Angiostrongylus costaricensis TaxID=334426 RepID=A0A0R3PZ01_ANGCS|nr:unnamed protein product [Angiostrongylus costaricensis]
MQQPGPRSPETRLQGPPGLPGKMGDQGQKDHWDYQDHEGRQSDQDQKGHQGNEGSGVWVLNDGAGWEQLEHSKKRTALQKPHIMKFVCIVGCLDGGLRAGRHPEQF